jgi:hypothetical protein
MGAEWSKRVSLLCATGLPTAVASCAGAGLHPDMVARLGLVLLVVAGWAGSYRSPTTWDKWYSQARGNDCAMAEDLPLPSDQGTSGG